MNVKLRETILWHNGYIFLNEHLIRLARSCNQLNFVFPQRLILKKISEIELKFYSGVSYKLMLVISQDGSFDIQYDKLTKKNYGKKYVTLSKKKVQSTDRLLYYKTTNKTLYQREFAKYKAKGFFDVLFTNEKDELTEGTFNNIIIRNNGRFYTPPVKCGLVAGVYRALCLKRLFIQEKILYKDDLFKAERIFLCNSLLGMFRVTYKKQESSLSKSNFIELMFRRYNELRNLMIERKQVGDG